MPGKASSISPRLSRTAPPLPELAAAYKLPASRVSGAGEIIASTKRSILSYADSNGLEGSPTRLRIKLDTVRTNLSQAVYLPPSGLIDFKSPTNSGFDCASAANSCTSVAP